MGVSIQTQEVERCGTHDLTARQPDRTNSIQGIRWEASPKSQEVQGVRATKSSHSLTFPSSYNRTNGWNTRQTWLKCIKESSMYQTLSLYSYISQQISLSFCSSHEHDDDPSPTSIPAAAQLWCTWFCISFLVTDDLFPLFNDVMHALLVPCSFIRVYWKIAKVAYCQTRVLQ